MTISTASREHNTAVYAFSADPITLGHIDIVTRIHRTFSKIIVGIGCNPFKTYHFPLEQRLSLARSALAHLPNVEVLAFEGMLVDFAYEQRARTIVRGIRNSADFEQEQVLHQVGSEQQVDVDTHILFADPRLAHVSSSVVRAIAKEGGDIQKYVPIPVKTALEETISGRTIVGLTGTIAAGKSTVADQLVQQGKRCDVEIHNIELDDIAHDILADLPGARYEQLRNEIIAHFGDEVIDGQGHIIRSRLGEIVFRDNAQRIYLNRLLRKPVEIQLRKRIRDLTGVILINTALLVECEMLTFCNGRVILVTVDPDAQLNRLKKRGYSKQQYQARISAQLSQYEKRAEISHFIENEKWGRLLEFKTDNTCSVARLFQELTQAFDLPTMGKAV